MNDEIFHATVHFLQHQRIVAGLGPSTTSGPSQHHKMLAFKANLCSYARNTRAADAPQHNINSNRKHTMPEAKFLCDISDLSTGAPLGKKSCVFYTLGNHQGSFQGTLIPIPAVHNCNLSEDVKI